MGRLHPPKHREAGHGHHSRSCHWKWCSLSTVLLLIAAALLYGTLALHSAAEEQHQQTGHLLPTFHLLEQQVAASARQGIWGRHLDATTAAGSAASQQQLQRQAVVVADVPGHAGPPYILPRLIHQTVKDKASMSCEVQESVRSWIELNPGFKHKLYDDADLAAFVRQHYPELVDLFEALPTNIERTDTWRYLVLHKLGGVYADSDVKCMQPIATWNQEHGFDAALLVGIAKRNQLTGATSEFNQFVMAAMPGHPVLAAMPMVIATNLAAHHLGGGAAISAASPKAHDNQILMRTGPKAFTSAIKAYAGRLGAPWPVNSTLADEQGGVLFGSVRAMPKFALGMGWDTLDHNMSCEQVKQQLRPEALICHQFFGSWKAKPEEQLRDRKLTYGDCGRPALQHDGVGDAAAGQEGSDDDATAAELDTAADGDPGADGGFAAMDAGDGEGTVEVVDGGEGDAAAAGGGGGMLLTTAMAVEDPGGDGGPPDGAAAGEDGGVEVVTYTEPTEGEGDAAAEQAATGASQPVAQQRRRRR